MNDLARFIDRLTIEYVRIYPHPIARVWRAITDPAELVEWFMPAQIDLELGGAYQFGGPDWTGEVVAIDPPKLIRLSGRNPSGAPFWFQYELSEESGVTRMRFVVHNQPGYTYKPDPDHPGGDLPGGNDTPWAPGMVGGWHELFDALRNHLAGRRPGDNLLPSVVGEVAKVWAKSMVQSGEFDQATADRYVRDLRREAEVVSLNEIYRAHIKATIPPAEGPADRVRP
jgi:uncharacterized protein YndB with AHSA1/START domain